MSTNDELRERMAEQIEFVLSQTPEALADENAKLRERVAKLEELTDGKRYIPQEWYQLVTTENAKLRELVRDYEHCSMHADCDRCEYDGTTSTHCPLSPCFPDADELRELGVD